jgi:hypothetical protein
MRIISFTDGLLLEFFNDSTVAHLMPFGGRPPQHVHNLGFLRTQAERLDRRLFAVWPRDSRKERAMFEKLKDAYVKARYSRHYRISAEELTWLGAQVEELGRVVHAVCSERITELEGKVAEERG